MGGASGEHTPHVSPPNYVPTDRSERNPVCSNVPAARGSEPEETGGLRRVMKVSDHMTQLYFVKKKG